MILDWKDPLEEEMATYSSILAWKIPLTEEHVGLCSMGSQRLDMTEQPSIPHVIQQSHSWASIWRKPYLRKLTYPKVHCSSMCNNQSKLPLLASVVILVYSLRCV